MPSRKRYLQPLSNEISTTDTIHSHMQLHYYTLRDAQNDWFQGNFYESGTFEVLVVATT